MRQRRGPAPAGQHEAGLQQRQVEAAAVERDDGARTGQQRLERRQQRRLVVEVTHEVLQHDQASVLHPRDADQERVGPGAAGEPGGLGVEEEEAVGGA